MTPDPHFLFLTATHREALAGLVYAIVIRKGFVVVSGDAGTGKDSIDYLELFSGGIPRVINAICDNALLLAFSEGRGSVWPEHIVTVVKELVLYEADAQPDSEAPCASEALSQANGALAWGAAVASERPIPMPTLARYRALARTSRLHQSREKSG